MRKCSEILSHFQTLWYTRRYYFLKISFSVLKMLTNVKGIEVGSKILFLIDSMTRELSNALFHMF